MIGINFTVWIQFTGILYIRSKIAHKRIGRLIEPGPVEMDPVRGHAGLFFNFPVHCLFFLLSTIQITSDQNVKWFSILLDQQDFISLLINHAHANCHIEFWETVIIAGQTEGNDSFSFQWFFY